MSCNRAVLVEACFDDRLGKAEKASLERHLPEAEVGVFARQRHSRWSFAVTTIARQRAGRYVSGGS